MQILSKKIPLELEMLVDDPNWRYLKAEKIMRLFKGYEVLSPIFFNEEEIKYNTQTYIEYCNNEERTRNNGEEILYSLLGNDHPTIRPGAINQNQLLLIGDGGIEEPIGLFYSKEDVTPSIIYLNPQFHSWEVVFNSFEDFLGALKI